MNTNTDTTEHVTMRITNEQTAEQFLAQRGITAEGAEGERHVKVQRVCGRCLGSGRFGPLQVNAGICFQCQGLAGRREWVERVPVIKHARTLKRQDAERARYQALADKRQAEVAAREAEAQAREQQRQARLAALRAQSRHVGTVGERREFALQVMFVREISSPYGTTTLYGCRDQDGNAVRYFASRPMQGWEQGAVVTCVACVKAHETYQGEQQTRITRAKPLAEGGAR